MLADTDDCRINICLFVCICVCIYVKGFTLNCEDADSAVRTPLTVSNQINQAKRSVAKEAQFSSA